MPQGVSYVRHEHEPANPYIRKHNAHQSTSGPLPCTIEAITRSGTDIPSSRPTGPFSPNVVEKEFSEVPHSPGPIQQVVLCRDSEMRSLMYIRNRQYLRQVLWPP